MPYTFWDPPRELLFGKLTKKFSSGQLITRFASIHIMFDSPANFQTLVGHSGSVSSLCSSWDGWAFVDMSAEHF